MARAKGAAHEPGDEKIRDPHAYRIPSANREGCCTNCDERRQRRKLSWFNEARRGRSPFLSPRAIPAIISAMLLAVCNFTRGVILLLSCAFSVSGQQQNNVSPAAPAQAVQQPPT